MNEEQKPATPPKRKGRPKKVKQVAEATVVEETKNVSVPAQEKEKEKEKEPIGASEPPRCPICDNKTNMGPVGTQQVCGNCSQGVTVV